MYIYNYDSEIHWFCYSSREALLVSAPDHCCGHIAEGSTPFGSFLMTSTS